jgi:hypothetical protein
VRHGRALCLVLLGLSLVAGSFAEEPDAPKKKVSLRDPLDGALDLSDLLIEARGFIPVPILITEPALGNFGGGVAPVFLTKRPPTERDGELVPNPPDITAAAGAYTANSSWFAGGGRSATLARYDLRYKVAAGYGDVNLDFYDTLPSGEARAFAFNGRVAPFFLRVGKPLRDRRFLLGLQYKFANTKLKLVDSTGELPSFVTDREIDSTASAAGVVAEFDSRDTLFTPDRGLKTHFHFDLFAGWLGSDDEFGRLAISNWWYQPLKTWTEDRAWIGALRLDWQQAFGDPPFYLLPYVDMRGVPTVRYQGRTTLLAETEQRVDFTRRWSAIAFGGVAKAFDDVGEASEADLVYGVGGGFRYLIARKFKLRMGVDIARGPEKWAYYIVFGNTWGR